MLSVCCAVHGMQTGHLSEVYYFLGKLQFNLTGDLMFNNFGDMPNNTYWAIISFIICITLALVNWRDP